ncbi:hypothetical protein QUB80_10925 [Chlorogloeopsis sp. ULAP01]|uniref:hypothetical protein n=1 Tax=Chlorogloeopsis sp. ULAP01 TaxID=3056483 RepID=UPI0025AA7C37|nr:hypothetical protein [Chlorogloeopsis sp. ULAP01]MDM9381216.1 hypothetical protein [Chlorogloeopsis sp. ULAP01]
MFYKYLFKNSSQSNLNVEIDVETTQFFWQELNEQQTESIRGGFNKIDFLDKAVEKVFTIQPEAEGKIRGTLILT